ncbi:FimV/HubP family polar landmark protein [Rheinheimera metallidurans]|uniref:FimV/HubP family polar landmark protein n=1 Tax=Rheinheimera metallidurans TaxID=2925781 RepID=UPI003001B221
MPLLFLFVIAVSVNFLSFVQAQESTVQIRGPRSTDAAPAPLTIGPLSPSDTLWRVAERIKPEGNISLYQVMYALYLKNPDAFLDNNLNHLRPGVVLVLPSLQDIQQIDINVARQKSEQDDKDWAKRQKAAVVKSVTPKKPEPIETVEPKWQAELERIGQQRRQDLDSLRGQFADSMQQVTAIVEENQQLKNSLISVEQELALIKAQLGEDSELQLQIKQLLAQQAELLQAKVKQDSVAAEQSDWQQWFKNPIVWILAACAPALLILFGILLWVKKRGQRTEKVLSAAATEPVIDPSYHSPLPPLDESSDLDESLFEIDDALLEDAFNDVADLPSDQLPDDMLTFDDALSFEDDSLLPADINTAEQDAVPDFDPDNILSDTDLSALLAADDDDDDIIELADEHFDIDDVLDATQKQTSAPPADIENIDVIDTPVNEIELEDSEEFDIDDLIDDINFEQQEDEQTYPELAEPALQELQLKQALTDTTPVAEQDVDSIDDILDIDVSDMVDNSVQLDRFDSSELDEFAESLAAESDALSLAESLQEHTANELTDSDEAMLNAELAELLDQVDNNAADIKSEQFVADNDNSMANDEPEDALLASLDLTEADDASVVKPTEAALSVENPSKILAQYPELELTDELTNADEFAELLLDDELPADDDLTELDELDDLDQNILSENDEELELDPIPDAQFDSLMSELEAMADNLEAMSAEQDSSIEPQVIAPPSASEDGGFDFNDDDFVEIDSLLANAELQEHDVDRFNQLNVDVGLDDYADIIGEHERRDVDREDNGYSAKLDLVRAYIEMDDSENADLLLDDILASDAPEHVKSEAQSLKQ